MSFMIPSNRVHQYEKNEILSGGGDIPTQSQNLVGGALKITSISGGEKIFMVVNIGGDPALTSHRKQKTFTASSPACAATKAFYSWWRSMRKSDESMRISDDSADISPYQETEYTKLLNHLQQMESKTDNIDLFKKRKGEFLHTWQRINQKALEESLLVRLAVLGSKGNYAPRNYIVKYERNTNPNWMEFWGPSKGISDTFSPIVVNAKPRLAKRDDVLPPNIHYLERDLQLMN
jgi:hypothetical protein